MVIADRDVALSQEFACGANRVSPSRSQLDSVAELVNGRESESNKGGGQDAGQHQAARRQGAIADGGLGPRGGFLERRRLSGLAWTRGRGFLLFGRRSGGELAGIGEG